jgi:DNA-binding CsgD family transcriptional regulator
VDELRKAIGFDRWCWRLVDPASVLFTSGVGEHDLWADVVELARLEQSAETVNTLWERAHGRRPAASLGLATRGDYALSARWNAVLGPAGIGDELRAASIDGRRCFADLHLWRDNGDQAFSPEDVELVESVAKTVAPALRRRVAAPAATDTGVGVLIFGPDLEPRSWTDAAGMWLSDQDAVGAGRDAAGALAVVARLAQERTLGIDETSARVRLRTSTGWVVIEGSGLQGLDAGGIAVTIRAAAPSEIFDLFCLAYDLTRRERELVELIADGADTKRIAAAMVISPHTVQDHLKSVFEKAGVRSRRELVSALGA